LVVTPNALLAPSCPECGSCARMRGVQEGIARE
jgi:hypothetical protein